MVTEERMAVFLSAFDTPNSPLLEEIEREARAAHVPVIRREVQSLLKVLTVLKKPEHILEVGTAVGFSALLMSAYAPPDCRIMTIENNAERSRAARANFARAKKEAQITLLEGDASDVLGELARQGVKADFLFMDAAKGQYIHYLPDVLTILTPGGCLVSDNVLHGGDVPESRFAVERRDRTIHARMREYLYALKNEESLVTSILPVGDGVTVSVKK